MSHGGGESEGLHEKPAVHVKRKSGGKSDDEFARGVAKIAVAQICESAGFQTFQQSALETLCDVAVRYVHSVGKSAMCYANLAGRSQGNALDVIQSLEELGAAQGFAGASDVDRCLATSGTVREIVQYVADAEDIPFAYSIPRFPVLRERKLGPNFSDVGEEPPGNHIPAWLPTFPDPQTFLRPLPGNEGAAITGVERIEMAKQHKADSSLLTVRSELVCNGFNRQQCHASGDSVKGKEVAQSNPFLVAPVQYVEKEVSHVDPLAKLSIEVVTKTVEHSCPMSNQEPVLGTFAPAIDAMRSGFSDSDEGQKKALLHQRATVQFKIGVGKKSLATSLEMRPQNKGVEMIGSWFTMDDEKDDKKRRAGKILKQSMENPGELTQL